MGVCFGLAAQLGALEVNKPVTLEELQQRQANNKKAYEKAGLQQVEQAVEIRKQTRSLMDQSCFLVGRFGYALVPKGSVLSLGKGFEIVNEVPTKGEFLMWESFARKHRSSLRMVPVTADHLEGRGSRESLEETKAASSEAGTTCVTTFEGRPARIGKLLETSQTESPE